MSLPRGAWIEIFSASSTSILYTVAPRGAWIENIKTRGGFGEDGESLPRGAWIEILSRLTAVTVRRSRSRVEHELIF